MFQSMKNFKTRYMLTIKYISKSKETLQLLLNTRIILSSNKIQQLQKQIHLRKTPESLFLYLEDILQTIYVCLVYLTLQLFGEIYIVRPGQCRK